MNIAARAVELRDDMRALSNQHFLGFYGDNTSGILDADLHVGGSEFEHIDKAELDTFIAAVNAAIAAFGDDDDGNDFMGASHKLIG